MNRLTAPALVLGVLLANMPAAQACACCSSTAQRTVEVRKLDAAALTELARLRFAPEAKLALGEGYDEAVKGLQEPSEDFTLALTRGKDRIDFALRDEKGRAGTLSLLAAKTLSVFEVDPRDSQDTGAGPSLYKEWKLTANVAGDGIFEASVGPKRRITLVLHGRGNSCTSADDFKHWTLLVHGPGTETITFFGKLVELAAAN